MLCLGHTWVQLPQHIRTTVSQIQACVLESACQVQQRSEACMPPQGLELTKVAFCLNTLSLSGVKNKACQSLTAWREKDINYGRQRVERSCREREVLLLSCHLPCVTARALLQFSHREEVGPSYLGNCRTGWAREGMCSEAVESLSASLPVQLLNHYKEKKMQGLTMSCWCCC